MASVIHKAIVAVALSCFTSSQGIVTTASKVNGTYLYDPSTVPLLAEILKLVISAALLFWALVRNPRAVRMTMDWKIYLHFLVPSLIYLFQNNISFLILRYLDPATYQILNNVKIVSTGIFFMLLLKRRLSFFQWLALLLLPLAALTSQLTACQGQPMLAHPLIGYVLGLLAVCCSSLASVYVEYLLKKNNDSIYWQNIQLYSFGIVFNLLHLIINDPWRYLSPSFWTNFHIFDGYNGWTFAVLANFSLTGLLVSWIMKFADNIVKAYSISMEMLSTMLFSYLLFGTHPTPQLLVAICIVAISIQLYFLMPAQLTGAGAAAAPPPKPAKSAAEEEMVPLVPKGKNGDHTV
eukprot:jgi/Mesvir1/26132/Mv06846-RA.1